MDLFCAWGMRQVLDTWFSDRRLSRLQSTLSMYAGTCTYFVSSHVSDSAMLRHLASVGFVKLFNHHCARFDYEPFNIRRYVVPIIKPRKSLRISSTLTVPLRLCLPEDPTSMMRIFSEPCGHEFNGHEFQIRVCCNNDDYVC